MQLGHSLHRRRAPIIQLYSPSGADVQPHLTQCFLDLDSHEFYPPNGTLIGSAVFAWLIGVPSTHTDAQTTACATSVTKSRTYAMRVMRPENEK